MVLLKRTTGLILLLSLTAVSAEAFTGWIRDLSLDALVQGRLTVHPYDALPDRAVLYEPANADIGPGEWRTDVYLKRVELGIRLDTVWPGWSLRTQAFFSAVAAHLQDLYVEYRPDAVLRLRIGRMRVPFGAEAQIGSAALPVPERSLLYGFGNFGWAGDLGMRWSAERDTGLRVDWTWPAGFASLAPFVQTGLLLGEGQNLRPTGVPHAAVRLGIRSRLEEDDLRHELVLALSGRLGYSDFEIPVTRYLPIGDPGTLDRNPGAVMDSADLPADGWVGVAGADVSYRIQNLRLSAEWMSRRLADTVSSGYTLTGVWEAAPLGLDAWELVARWESAASAYADGAHAPGRRYQAATAGLTWSPVPAWKLHACYLKILWDDRVRDFPGSDLALLQAQWVFGKE